MVDSYRLGRDAFLWPGIREKIPQPGSGADLGVFTGTIRKTHTIFKRKDLKRKAGRRKENRITQDFLSEEDGDLLPKKNTLLEGDVEEGERGRSRSGTAVHTKIKRTYMEGCCTKRRRRSGLQQTFRKTSCKERKKPLRESRVPGRENTIPYCD